MEQALDKKIAVLLQEAQYLSLAFDEWTDFANRRYVAIVAHFYESNCMKKFVLKHHHLTCDYTAENLKDFVIKTCKDFQISDRVFLISTDTTASLKNSVEMLNRDWMPCLLHVINLVTQHSYEKIPRIADIIKLAATLSKSTIFKDFVDEELKKAAKNPSEESNSKLTKVHSFSKNRWTSLYNIIHEMSVLAPKIIKFYLKIRENAPNREILQICKEMDSFSQRIIEIYRLLQDEKENPIFFALCYIKKLTEIAAQLPDKFQQFRNEYNQNLNNYLMQYKNQYEAVIRVAASLNPKIDATKYMTSNQIEEVKQTIESALNHNPTTEIIGTKRVSSLMDEICINQENSSDSEYSTWCRLRKIGKGMTISEYWEANKETYPSLYKLFKKYSSMVIASVSSERVFSKSSNIVTLKRGSLSVENVESLAKLVNNEELARESISEHEFTNPEA